MRANLVRRALLAATVVSLISVPALFGAVANPSFETNGGAGTNVFTSWTVVDQPGGSGSWFVQTGLTSPPPNVIAVPGPTNGSFSAMSSQTGPGSHIIYQDISVLSTDAVLRFDLYLNNQAGAYVTPATLDYTAGPNQQFRADIMSTAAPITDVGAGVLLNIYQTKVGDPLVSGYKQVSVSLAPFVGQTVRVRFAEVDNTFFFAAGVDNITTSLAIPTLSPVMMGLLALALVAAAIVLLKRN